jgi:hypothetical protein
MQTQENKLNDLVIQLHNLARTMEPSVQGSKVRILADQLSVIGREYHEELSNKKMYDASKIVIGL